MRFLSAVHCIVDPLTAPLSFLFSSDPKGDGTGGCSVFGLIDSYQSSYKNGGEGTQKSPPDVTQSQRRFLQSQGRLLSPDELRQKGVVVAMEMGNVAHTVGSQFLITLGEENGLGDLVSNDGGTDNAKARQLSLGIVMEDSQNILSKLNRAYCDDDGRPYADIRIQRALVIHDPFEDPPGMGELLRWRGVACADAGDSDDKSVDLKEGLPLAPQSPAYDHPPEEVVPLRILADDSTLFATAGWDDKDGSGRLDEEDDEDEAMRQKRLELQERQEEEWRKRQDESRAVMLEMLGDRPTADARAPENVLFVCKLNPLTNDEDLELIFSRFDADAKADIIRDPDTGASLQYAFVEFTTDEACNEAYLKMNNALVDDRRIRVDFSQSVAHVWDRYNKRYRRGDRSGIDRGFVDSGRGNYGRGSGRGRGRDWGHRGGDRSSDHRLGDRSHHLGGDGRRHRPSSSREERDEMRPTFDDFGRVAQLTRDASEMGRDRRASRLGTDRGRHHHPRSDSRISERENHRPSPRPREGDGHRFREARSRSPCRDRGEMRRSRSNSRRRDRGSSISSSRSDASDDFSDRHRHGRKHRKRRHRDRSSDKGSGNRERKRKRKKHHRHSRREFSDDEEQGRDRKHRRHHRGSDGDRHRRGYERSS